MGCRGNIIIKQESGLFLGVYHHNGGHLVRQLTQAAILAVQEAGRDNDESYCNRIMISTIVGNRWSQAYDYGIYVGTTMQEAMGENEMDVVMVDWQARSVTVYDYDNLNRTKSYTLDEFTQTEFKVGYNSWT